MDDGDFLFKMLVPLNFSVFAFIFLVTYFYEKRLKYVGWLGLSFFSGTMACLLDLMQPHREVAALDAIDVANLFFWLVGVFCTIAMARRYQQKIPLKLISGGLILAISGQLYFGYFNYIFNIQEALSNFWASAFLILAAITIGRNIARPIDRIVAYTLAAIALSNVVRVTGVFLPVIDGHGHQVAEMHDTVQLFASAICANAGGIALVSLSWIDNVRIYKSETITDPLTGLHNRRGLDQTLLETKANQKNGITGYGLIVCDIDNFKAINDQFGHQTGDVILKKFGQFLKKHTASYAEIARMGGEEFALLVRPEMTDQLSTLTEYLRFSLSKMDYQLTNDRRVTASFGCTLILEDEDFAAAYRRADDALYRAKANGRNCIEIDIGVPAKNELSKAA